MSVHIYSNAGMYCGIDVETWPPGNSWVPDLRRATCPGCIAAWNDDAQPNPVTDLQRRCSALLFRARAAEEILGKLLYLGADLIRLGDLAREHFAHRGELPTPTEGALFEVLQERGRQDEKWGEVNHPDGTGGEYFRCEAEDAKIACDGATKRGALTFRHILREEAAEAFAETDAAKLRAELVQVAAVAVKWIEAIDRRTR